MHDFRFLPAVEHVALYLVIWLVALVLLVTFLALVVHTIRVQWLSRTMRLVFYLPGALAGKDIREDCGAQVPGCGWLEP